MKGDVIDPFLSMTEREQVNLQTLRLRNQTPYKGKDNTRIINHWSFEANSKISTYPRDNIEERKK
jgi:hypothetical protein